jgi:ubiquinone/menaquinone biosynthesis C-methylase UbiE
MHKQRNIFLEGEGDAWFERNHTAIQARLPDDGDPVIAAIKSCLSSPRSQGGGTLLEVGCGEAKRLGYIERQFGLEGYGIEPSEKAIEVAKKNGLKVIQGTADSLPFESGKFDFVVFGFCLYLCDREDLFRIAYEADRVLKNQGWLVIHDFFSKNYRQRDYHHFPGVKSFKMDYRTLFEWHPGYTCFSQTLTPHGDTTFTDDPDDWVATSVLRKKTFE